MEMETDDRCIHRPHSSGEASCEWPPRRWRMQCKRRLAVSRKWSSLWWTVMSWNKVWDKVVTLFYIDDGVGGGSDGWTQSWMKLRWDCGMYEYVCRSCSRVMGLWEDLTLMSFEIKLVIMNTEVLDNCQCDWSLILMISCATYSGWHGNSWELKLLPERQTSPRVLMLFTIFRESLSVLTYKRALM